MEFQENQRGQLFTFRDVLNLLRLLVFWVISLYRKVAMVPERNG